jgi:hypothetical protein
MHLKQEENLIKIYHHHPTTFLIRVLRVAVVSLPFYFVASFFAGVVDSATSFMIYGGVTALFALFIAYDLSIFYLNTLVITNHRVVLISWPSIFKRKEAEAEIRDIQDITTQENGLFAAIPFFDFGLFKLDTASAKTILMFADAPDPEGIKHFIYHLEIKPSTIRSAVLNNVVDDSERRKIREEVGVAGDR